MYVSHEQTTNTNCYINYLSCVLQKNVHSTKFVSYYLDKIIGKVADVAEGSEGEDPKLELLKQLAEMSQWCPVMDELPSRLKNIYTAVQVQQLYMYIYVCVSHQQSYNSMSV